MEWFDTHAHISDSRFETEEADVLARAREAGVTHILNVFDGTKPVSDALAFLDHIGLSYAATGVHPHDASHGIPTGLMSAFSDPRFRALGEIGLDYHYDFSPRDVQREIFACQLDLAHQLQKPVILHIREAHGEALDILSSYYKQGLLTGGVVHCYSGSKESAREYLNMGFHISFTGSVTFKNANKLLDAARYVPLDRIMVETDCPYMAPVPLRGKRNEPAYVVHTGRFLAALRGEEEELFAHTTTQNAFSLFGSI